MKLVVLILSVLILILDVKALSVVSDHLKDNTLHLIEGTSAIYSIRLQNPESYEVSVKVTYDASNMEALDFKEEYILEPKSSTRVEFNVTSPKYNKKNNLHDMSYTIHQLTGAGGGIGFLPKISKIVRLESVKDPDRFHINYFYVGYVIVLIVVISLLYWKANPNRKIIK